MSKKNILRIGIGILVVILISGTGYGLFKFLNQPTGALTVWTIQGNEKAISDMTQTYYASGGKYKINIQPMTEANYENNSLFALASNKGPDIWVIPSEWMTEHQNKLVAAPVGALATAISSYSAATSPMAKPSAGRTNAQIISSDYPPIVANDVLNGSNVYGVPLDLDSLVLFYNKTKITTPPTTWQDVSNAAKNMSKSTNGNLQTSAIAMGTLDNTTDHASDIFTSMLLQSGVSMVDNQTSTAAFNLGPRADLSPGAQALKLYSSFSDPTQPNYSWNDKMGSSLAALKSGKTMMAVGYASDFSLFDPMGTSNIGVAPLPQLNPTNPKTYGRSLIAAVTKNSANSAEAWKLISLFANPDVANAYSTSVRLPAARKDVATAQNLGPQFKALTTQVGNVTAWQKKEVDVADKSISDAMALAITSKKTAQDSLDFAAKEYTAFLQADTGIRTQSDVLTVWQSDDNAYYNYANSISIYLSKHKDVRQVLVFNRPAARFEYELLNAVAAGEGPDIALIPNDSVRRYSPFLLAMPSNTFDITKGQYQGLDTYTKLFAPAATTDNVINGQVYGAPLSMESLVILYNKDLMHSITNQKEHDSNEQYIQNANLFSTGPATWDELKTMDQILTTRSGNTVSVAGTAIGAGGNVVHSEDIYAAMVKQMGGQMSDPDRQAAGFQLPASTTDLSIPGQQALNLYRSFSDPTQPFYTWNASLNDSLTALANGQAVMAFGYPRDSKKIFALNPSINISQFSLPQLNKVNPAVDIASYYTATVPRSSKMTDNALAFIKETILQAKDSSLFSPFTTTQVPGLDERLSGNRQAVENLFTQSWDKGNFPQLSNAALKSLLDNQITVAQAAAKVTQYLQTPVLVTEQKTTSP